MKKILIIGILLLLTTITCNNLFANSTQFPPDKKGKTHQLQHQKTSKQNVKTQRKGDKDCPCTKNEKKKNQKYHKKKK